MKTLSIALLLFVSSFSAKAELSDCKNLYVGTVTAQKGVTYVVLKASKGDGSGSYAQNFNGWTESDKSSAMSILLAAKMSGHRVNVTTFADDGCSITSGGNTFRYVQLASNP